MIVLVIDAQGGGIGKQIIQTIRKRELDVEIIAVGTNSTATGNMIRAGADNAATGENPVIVNCRTADIVVGPIGIVIADSMYGEITPNMALAVAQCRARKILIPINKCENFVVGVNDLTVSHLISCAVDEISSFLE